MVIVIPKYYKGLNGLRAISVIAVLIFHLNASVPFFSTFGWLGVDLFFVISGFLITGILIDSKVKQNYFRNFYIRRSLRIFPLYYLVIILISSYTFLMGDLGLDIIYYFFYLQNFYAAIEGVQLNQFLSHTWSLAVEEQFYFFWPLVIWFGSVKKVKNLSLAIIILIPLVRFYFAASDLHPYFQNSLIISRIDSLVWGGLLAIYARKPEMNYEKMNRLCNILFLAGTVGVFFLLVILGSGNFIKGIDSFTQNVYLRNTYGHMIFTFTAMVFTSIVGKIAFQTTSTSRVIGDFFELNPINFIGKISYGIYLYHLPVFVMVNKISTHFGIYDYAWILKFGVTLIISIISWYCFELWFIRRKEALAPSLE